MSLNDVEHHCGRQYHAEGEYHHENQSLGRLHPEDLYVQYELASDEYGNINEACEGHGGGE